MNSFLKGMSVGLVVGSAICVASIMPKMPKKSKCIKHSVGKALKAAGSVIDNLQEMM